MAVRRKTSLEKEVIKVSDAEIAEKLNEMLSEWKKEVEKMIISELGAKRAEDVKPIQDKYKAILNLESFLREKIARGLIAKKTISDIAEGDN